MEENTLWWDKKSKQLLSGVCRACPEPHFQRRSPELPHIGCCAYEPVFTLFEIYKMIAADATDFFLKQIYENPLNEIHAYEIVAGATIHPLFYKQPEGELTSPAQRYDQLRQSPHTMYKAVDERLAYAVCQFFVDGKGCGLAPQYKTSICRSFICSAIEERLSTVERKKLSDWQRTIRDEAEPFHREHRNILMQKGWTLTENIENIIDYFQRYAHAT